MASLAESYPTLVAALADHYGQPRVALERRSAFEAMLAAGLARSADPGRADAALESLNRSGLLDPQALAGTAPAEVLDTLRDAGLNLPARAASLLPRLARWYSETFGDQDPPRHASTVNMSVLREQLAALSGVGLATADAILLALGQPTYPVDRGTYRVLVRHGWIDPATEYDQASELLTRQAAGNPEEIARLSIWLMQIGRQFCVLRSPKCQRCPLRCVLPEQGPLEPEG